MVDECVEEIELAISARDLDNLNFIGKSDPICLVNEW